MILLVIIRDKKTGMLFWSSCNKKKKKEKNIAFLSF
jgi:hypothetical protein